MYHGSDMDKGSLAHGVQKICNGNIGVMPTDTIYGIVADAHNKDAVERVYSARERSPKKPCIILIGGMFQLKPFGVELSEKAHTVMSDVWPGPVSVIVPCNNLENTYLHRGTFTLAFRCPDKEWLRSFLLETGPIIAPSANIEGHVPAQTTKDARSYFGESVDFYLDGGELLGEPSTILDVTGDGVCIVREGVQPYFKK